MSVNAAPVMAVALAFVSVIVSTDVAFGATVAGLNAFAIAGCTSTVNVAEAPATLEAGLVVVRLPVELL